MAGAAVQQPACELQGRGLGLVASGAAFGAAQHGTDAGQQLAGLERLAQVVIGAQLQAHDAVGDVAQRGEEDDGHRGFGAQGTEQLQPVHAGKHDVHDDQAAGHAALDLEELRRVPRRAGGKAVATQIVGKQGADFLVVIDDTDGMDRVHGPHSGAEGQGIMTKYVILLLSFCSSVSKTTVKIRTYP